MAHYLGGLTWKELGQQTAHEATADNLLDRAAQMAFYFLLALFPFLIFAISILGLLASNSHFEQQLVHWLTQAMPHSASGLVQNVVQQTTHRSGSGKLSFGILFSLWTASSGMVAVIQGLNAAFDLTEERSWLRQRFTALWLTAAMSVFMLLAVAMIVFGGWIGAWLGSRTGLSDVIALLWNILQWPLAFVLVTVALSILYRYAPNQPQPQWKWVTPGAIAAVVLWMIASLGFRIYLMYSNSYASTYGSLGAVIILIMWFYITAIAFLLGAEVNAEIEAAGNQRQSGQSGQSGPASPTRRAAA